MSSRRANGARCRMVQVALPCTKSPRARRGLSALARGASIYFPPRVALPTCRIHPRLEWCKVQVPFKGCTCTIQTEYDAEIGAYAHPDNPTEHRTTVLNNDNKRIEP